MKKPVQIKFLGMERSPALEAAAAGQVAEPIAVRAGGGQLEDRAQSAA